MSDFVSETLAEVQARADKAREVNAQLLELRQEGSSPDGEVNVVVDATGRLMSLEISDDALSSSGEELAALIMETMSATQRQCAAQAAELAEQAWGRNSPTAKTIAEQAYGQVVDVGPADDDDDQPRRGATRLW